MDDYWDNYGEFNEAVEELKSTLKDTVKEEVTKELETLRKENRELKDRQENLTQLESEAAQLKAQAQREFDSAKGRALEARAKELLEALSEPAYRLKSAYVNPPKCDKCNDQRKLEFTYPSGKTGIETCDVCGTSKTVYSVVDAIVVEAKIARWGGKREIVTWYTPYYEDKDGDDADVIRGHTEVRFYKDEPFEKLGTGINFRDHDKAQEFADYLNSKN